ncbi:2-keto-3-deoxy-galactonokinase [Tsuneonella dongtanensis]|uniref:2-keto-3-deoxy-galactonokinase n=1 Tax=Tsuneonella dongtanensis TaxID=692370 RepID=A0A1B2AB39_9SPHN|nr:2-keto-3-deoxy-galactonokinase [Tsuneonella dongtanensis]
MRRVFALPETHNKWVKVSEDILAGFHTAMSGELFAALQENSILIPPESDPPHPGEAFDEGVRLALQHGGGNLMGILFAARTRNASGSVPVRDAASFLSGLIVGADVAGALPALEKSIEPIRLICSKAFHAASVVHSNWQDSSRSSYPVVVAPAGALRGRSAPFSEAGGAP